MTRDGLLNRIHKLGKRIGIDVSPHALRRAFVTINANKGRSLVMLQMACGHSDIKTTRSYCKTTEDEMIREMQQW
jgi:integrase/recombinase XerD